MRQARRSFVSILINITAVFFFYFELMYGVFTSSLGFHSSLLHLFELVLFGVFLLNVACNIWVYAKYYLFSTPVEVTVREKQLLGVQDNEPGFTLSPIKAGRSPGSEHSLVFSSTPSSQTAYSPASSPWSSLGHVTPTNLGSFTGSQSYTSPGASFMSPVGQYSLDRSASFSQGNMSSLSNVSGYSFNQSRSSSLPYSPGMSMSSLEGSGLRSRLSTSFRSPVSSDNITDMSSLRDYLREQDEKEYKKQLSYQTLPLSGSSFWSYGRPVLEGSHHLRNNEYQLACRSPQSHKSRTDDNDNVGEEVWRSVGVAEDELYLWIERLRKWLGNTIMINLAKEIDNINSQLRKIGSENCEIGEVGVSTLKQIALTKGRYVRTLNAMVPYLEFHSNQEYLVKRIKDLGGDGCLSEYSWNSGGSGEYYGKPWGEHLPTDASLVMYFFCTYMDSRLPPDPRYPDGKTFTSQYFMKTPEKPNLDKENLLLYQSSINPPHFQVVIGDTIYNLPKGRNNMFHTILFFLYHVRHKENGMLGRVNLGMSGVNLLWIIDT